MTTTETQKEQVPIKANTDSNVITLDMNQCTRLTGLHLSAYGKADVKGRNAWTINIPKAITDNTQLIDPYMEYDVILVKKNPQSLFSSGNLRIGVGDLHDLAFAAYR